MKSKADSGNPVIADRPKWLRRQIVRLPAAVPLASLERRERLWGDRTEEWLLRDENGRAP